MTIELAYRKVVRSEDGTVTVLTTLNTHTWTSWVEELALDRPGQTVELYTAPVVWSHDMRPQLEQIVRGQSYYEERKGGEG